MKDKFPEIYKRKIENLKSKVQKDFYYHAEAERNESKSIEKKVINDNKENKISLIDKINNIFKRPDFVYQAAVNIMYKNGENIDKKIIGIKENYLLTQDGEKIHINDISDIK